MSANTKQILTVAVMVLSYGTYASPPKPQLSYSSFKGNLEKRKIKQCQSILRLAENTQVSILDLPTLCSKEKTHIQKFV